MIGYRRHSFRVIHTLLRKIVEQPDDLESLLELQRLLCREIFHAEAKTASFREKFRAIRVELKTTRPAREQARLLRTRLSWIGKRIKAYRRLINIWRCFGDAIAFNYLDTFAIKQVFYETTSADAKQGAGSLSGKDGLTNEVAALHQIIGKGIPALLVDLTNSIRYGDICLLGGPDPSLIEVKSSERLNERGARQVAKIEKLHGFFENDIVTEFRALPELRRVTLTSQASTHLNSMHECIKGARERGYASARPEDGLIYLAITNGKPDLGAIFQELETVDAQLFFLNSYKSEGTWAPYYPFTLSLDNYSDLYDFIRGDLILCVFFDINVFRELVKLKGYEPCEDDENYLRFRDPKNFEGVHGVSWHMLKRVGFEFLSPSWLADNVVRIGADWAETLSLERPAE